MADMTTENESTIREIISQAVPVEDPLKDLVQKTKSDPGAPFEPETLALIAETRGNDRAGYVELREELKKLGVSARELDAATAVRRGVTDEGGAGLGHSQTELLLQLGKEAELFHTPDGRAFAQVDADGGRRTFEISDQDFGDWLRHRWYQETQNAPSPEALRAALRTLVAIAHRGGPEYEVHVRVAAHEGCYYLDLANEDGYVVKMSSDGWETVRSSPVRFLRCQGMRPLPMPERGGSLQEDLFPLLNLREGAQQVLIALWLVNSLIASPEYRLLVLQGEQGSAKSRTARTLRDLLDPSAGDVRSPPHSEHDLLISALHGHVLAFDNVSVLSQEMSDAFCRLATGGGLATRQLYTDRQQVLLNAVNPIILNGIEDIVTRADLVSRAISITLQPIPNERLRTKGELQRLFEDRWARILGALLDVAVHGLNRIKRLDAKPLSRMADFDLMATACETALWPAGTYEQAFAENEQESVDAGIEADTVAVAVLSMVRAMRAMRAGLLWKGTATDLLQELDPIHPTTRRTREWPNSAHALGGRLRRVAPLLRHKGIEIEFRGKEGHSNTRMIYITVHGTSFGEPLAALASLAPDPEAPALVTDTGTIVDEEALSVEDVDEVVDTPSAKTSVSPPSPCPQEASLASADPTKPKGIRIKLPKKKTLPT